MIIKKIIGCLAILTLLSTVTSYVQEQPANQ